MYVTEVDGTTEVDVGIEILVVQELARGGDHVCVTVAAVLVVSNVVNVQLERSPRGGLVGGDDLVVHLVVQSTR